MSAGSALVLGHDALLVDLDGVVYTGDAAVPGAVEALEACRRAGVRVVYVTNNASRTADEMADHLCRLGLQASADDVVSSAHAAASVLGSLVPAGAPVLVVGGGGLTAAVRARGLRPVTSAQDEPAAVVQGFHPDVGWRLLSEGAYAVQSGVPWVASNTDVTLPTARGHAPGNGALIGVIRAATGRDPIVVGKPGRALFDEAVRRVGARAPLVVGDRLDTDIEGATTAGCDSLLVLTGGTSAADLAQAALPRRPTYVGRDLSVLWSPYPKVLADDGRWRCEGWLVSRQADAVELAGAGEPMDGLRAVLAEAWSTPDPVDVSAALAELGLDRPGAR